MLLAHFLFTLFDFLVIVRFDSRVFPFFAFSSFHGRTFFGGFPSRHFRFFVFAPFDGFFGQSFGRFDQPWGGRPDRVRTRGGLGDPER